MFLKDLFPCHTFAFPFSEKKLLRDDEILKNLLVGTTVTIYFRDLGPQIGWTMVRNIAVDFFIIFPLFGCLVDCYISESLIKLTY